MILKINSKEVQSLLEAIDKLLEIKILIRGSIPNFKLNGDQLNLFNSLLNTLESKLQPIFVKYLHTDSYSISKISKEEFIFDLKKYIKKNKYILLSASHSKKILKNLGFDPVNIIVSGGPLFSNNYSKINPNLSDLSLQGIEKKCERLITQLVNTDWDNFDLLFLCETNNKADLIILEEIKEIERIIGKNIEIIKINSWKDIEV